MMPSRLTQINQLNFVCEDCSFTGRDKYSLDRHLQGSSHINRVSRPRIPNILDMTHEQQEDYITKTQQYKTDIEVLNNNPKYKDHVEHFSSVLPYVRGGTNENLLSKLKAQYEADRYRIFTKTLTYYKNEYNKQKALDSKKEQGEEQLAKRKKELVEQMKIKENKVKAKVFKHEMKIKKMEFLVEQQRQLQLAELGVIPDMSSLIERISQSRSTTTTEEEQSEHYSIDIPQLTRPTYEEPIVIQAEPEQPEPEQQQEPEPEQQQQPEPEPEPTNLNPNRFNMMFRKMRKTGKPQQWNNPEIYDEWKNKPKIRAITKRTTIAGNTDTYRIDCITVFDTNGVELTFYVSNCDGKVLYHEVEPKYDIEIQENTYNGQYGKITKREEVPYLLNDNQGEEIDDFRLFYDYRCVCGCGAVIGWGSNLLLPPNDTRIRENFEGEDTDCYFRNDNLYLKYKGDWDAILKHQ